MRSTPTTERGQVTRCWGAPRAARAVRGRPGHVHVPVRVPVLSAGIVAIALAGLVLPGGAGLGAQSRPQALSENQVKAAFLFNFARFVAWPDDAFTSASAPLRVAVVGDDGFGRDLEATVGGKPVDGHALRVERFASLDDVDDLDHCHILFAATADDPSPSQVSTLVRGRPVLTIGDAPGFAASGGVIGLVMQQSRVRFEVNLASAAAGRLTISSKLLRLAIAVHDGTAD